jgi:hypothetical protein
VAEAAVATDVGLYFYGVVPLGADVAGVRGLDDVEVEAVEHAGLAAIVSRVALDRPPGRSAELVAHARVVDTVARSSPVVPAQFGLILAHDLLAVARLLEEGADQYHDTLRALEGRVQLNLRATYEPEQVLNELVHQDPQVAELRRRTGAVPPGTPHPDLIRLGEAVSRGLNRKRNEDASSVLDVVLPFVSQHVVRPGGDYDVLDVALLVAHDEVDALEDALEDLAEVVHERLRLRLVGPVAPYDFVGSSPWG